MSISHQTPMSADAAAAALCPRVKALVEKEQGTLKIASAFQFNGRQVAVTVPVGIQIKEPLTWGKHVAPLIEDGRLNARSFPLAPVAPGTRWNLAYALFETPLLGAEKEAFLRALGCDPPWAFGSIGHAVASATWPQCMVGMFVQVLGGDPSPPEPFTYVDHAKLEHTCDLRRRILIRNGGKARALALDVDTPVVGYGSSCAILLCQELLPKP